MNGRTGSTDAPCRMRCMAAIGSDTGFAYCDKRRNLQTQSMGTTSHRGL